MRYFFDVYSSPLGHHFIIWRKTTTNKKKREYEVVCHRNSVFISHLVALAACEKWVRTDLQGYQLVREDCFPVLKWLERRKAETSITKGKKRQSDNRGRRRKLLSLVTV